LDGPNTSFTRTSTRRRIHRTFRQSQSNKGINAEIVDLRSIKPIDKETIFSSVEKTKRLLIVDEDYKSYGYTAEVAALVASEAFYHLEAPVGRLAIPDVPIPYSPVLEKYVIPDAGNIVDKAKEIMNA